MMGRDTGGHMDLDQFEQEDKTDDAFILQVFGLDIKTMDQRLLALAWNNLKKRLKNIGSPDDPADFGLRQEYTAFLEELRENAHKTADEKFVLRMYHHRTGAPLSEDEMAHQLLVIPFFVRELLVKLGKEGYSLKRT